MSDYTPTAEVSLDRLADLLSETNAQLAELREPLSDERFHDECAMRMAAALHDGSLERWVFDIKQGVNREPFNTVLAWQAYEVADTMLAERKRRRG